MTGDDKTRTPSLRERALRLLARREHTRAELARKLAVHTEDPAELERVLDDFERRGWLSERRVVEQMVQSIQEISVQVGDQFSGENLEWWAGGRISDESRTDRRGCFPARGLLRSTTDRCRRGCDFVTSAAGGLGGVRSGFRKGVIRGRSSAQRFCVRRLQCVRNAYQKHSRLFDSLSLDAKPSSFA